MNNINDSYDNVFIFMKTILSFLFARYICEILSFSIFRH